MNCEQMGFQRKFIFSPNLYNLFFLFNLNLIAIDYRSKKEVKPSLTHTYNFC